ncbi:DNA topoisomerase [Enterococcus lactis]|nr:DNA topoisomerase [Enterococcus lactis]
MTDHHALLPTENRARYEKLSNEEQKIYQMIVSRFLGLFAQPHKVSQTKVTVEFDKEQFIFRQNRVIKQGGKAKLNLKRKQSNGKRNADQS